MLASPISPTHHPTPTPGPTVSDSTSHHLDFTSFDTTPSVTLHEPLTPTHSPASSISDKQIRRRSRLPSFFARLSSASPSRSFRKHSNASLHISAVPDPASPAASADASDSIAHTLPRDFTGDQDSQPQPQPVPPSTTRNRYSLNPSLSTNHSQSPSLTSSPRTSQLDRSSGIFTSTSSYRLSVPLNALHHLQTITPSDISRKMHQTSSRLLRMTDDERPYTRVRILTSSQGNCVLCVEVWPQSNLCHFTAFIL
jgi:GTPase-activating protein SST2